MCMVVACIAIRPAGGVNHFSSQSFSTPASGVHTWHTGHYPMNHTTHMTPTCPLHNPICMVSAGEDLPPIGFVNTFPSYL